LYSREAYSKAHVHKNSKNKMRSSDAAQNRFVPCRNK
jgi:hypothetical protein